MTSWPAINGGMSGISSRPTREQFLAQRSFSSWSLPSTSVPICGASIQLTSTYARVTKALHGCTLLVRTNWVAIWWHGWWQAVRRLFQSASQLWGLPYSLARWSGCWLVISNGSMGYWCALLIYSLPYLCYRCCWLWWCCFANPFPARSVLKPVSLS